MKIIGFILYKIYYGDDVVYLGRTKQNLQDRLRGHFFKKPMHRNIDISLVSKIEYSKFNTEADMNLYEIYYINLLKPPFNVDDKTKDDLTVFLPEVSFDVFEAPIMSKWRAQLNDEKPITVSNFERYYIIPSEICELRSRKQKGEIDEETYYMLKHELDQERERLFKLLY